MPPVAAAEEQGLTRLRSGTPIYLDYHASTPCDPRVVEAMLPFFVEVYANPSSPHRSGREAAGAVADAREKVADCIGATPGEIAFTSGATESNNLAILGAARAAPSRRRRVIASAIEHKAVLGPMRALQREGFDFQVLPVESDGRVDLGALAMLVNDQTAVVSVQAANNEIGTLQPIAEIAQIVHQVGAVLHCDAAQALGRVPVDVADWNVDLLSISGHKCYGPKGVGALYVRGGIRNAPLDPLMIGGGQEADLRPGTLNVPGIVGLGRASEIIVDGLGLEMSRIEALRNALERTLIEQVRGIALNGALTRRLPGNSSFRISGVDAEAIIANTPDLVLSTGSACTSGTLAPSHVLIAIGLSRAEASETLRIGIGRFTRLHDVTDAARRLLQVITKLREIQAAV